jgi:tRNA (guanine37-N1)-methyltransferase
MSAGLNFTVFTLFPEMFPGVLGYSLLGKALQEEKWRLKVVNIRDYAMDKHQTVDDTPYGGGAGMVMRADVLAAAIDANSVNKLYYLSPRGVVLNQRGTEKIVQADSIGLICARYEGVDQRVLDEYAIEELSVGDYVLSGGEIAAMCVIDACVRQQNGVLGNALTLEQESFSAGGFENLLEYPLFTRPALWRDKEVPEVLRSGNHQAIEKWRLTQAEAITQQRRPDLWQKYTQE